MSTGHTVEHCIHLKIRQSGVLLRSVPHNLARLRRGVSDFLTSFRPVSAPHKSQQRMLLRLTFNNFTFASLRRAPAPSETLRRCRICFGLEGSFEPQLDSVECGVSGSRGNRKHCKSWWWFWASAAPRAEGVSPPLLPAAAAAAAALGFLWGGFLIRVLMTPAAVLYDTKRTKYVRQVVRKTAVELTKLRCGILSDEILILTVCLVFLTFSDFVGIFCMFLGAKRQQCAGCLITTHQQQRPSLSETEIWAEESRKLTCK